MGPPLVYRLRHQERVPERQVPSRVVYRPADGALLAALGRLLPRTNWGVFLVTPATSSGSWPAASGGGGEGPRERVGRTLGRNVRTACRAWLLIVSCHHLEHVLRTCLEHYNLRRPHRGRELPPRLNGLDRGGQ